MGRSIHIHDRLRSRVHEGDFILIPSRVNRNEVHLRYGIVSRILLDDDGDYVNVKTEDKTFVLLSSSDIVLAPKNLVPHATQDHLRSL